MIKTACTDKELNRIDEALPFCAHSAKPASPKMRLWAERKDRGLFGGAVSLLFAAIHHRLLRRCCYFEGRVCPASLKIGTFCLTT